MTKFTEALYESIRKQAVREYERGFDDPWGRKPLEYYTAKVAYEYAQMGFVR